MADNQTHIHYDDQLDELINSILKDQSYQFEDHMQIDQETDQLLSLARKVVTLSQNYPGEAKLSSQDKLKLLTEYRSLHHPVSKSRQETRFSFLKQGSGKWIAAGIGFLFLAAALLITTRGFSNLTASAGARVSLLPFLILATAIIAIAIALLRRK